MTPSAVTPGGGSFAAGTSRPHDRGAPMFVGGLWWLPCAMAVCIRSAAGSAPAPEPPRWIVQVFDSHTILRAEPGVRCHHRT